MTVGRECLVIELSLLKIAVLSTASWSPHWALYLHRYSLNMWGVWICFLSRMKIIPRPNRKVWDQCSLTQCYGSKHQFDDNSDLGCSNRSCRLHTSQKKSSENAAARKWRWLRWRLVDFQELWVHCRLMLCISCNCCLLSMAYFLVSFPAQPSSPFTGAQGKLVRINEQIRATDNFRVEVGWLDILRSLRMSVPGYIWTIGKILCKTTAWSGTVWNSTVNGFWLLVAKR